ncbi:MAG: glycosyltransferase, partial [Actinomycetota bacterium]
MRLVVGHRFFPRPVCDEDGVWRPRHGVEVVFGPDSSDGYDPRTGTVAAALAAAGWDTADAYVHCLPEYWALPADAAGGDIPLILAVGDWNVAGRLLHVLRPLAAGAVVDHAGAPLLRRLGYRVRAILPWGWDAGAWPLVDPAAPRDIDVLFAGNRNAVIHASRERWLARVAALAGVHRVVIADNVWGEEYRGLYARARLVFNHSVRGEANIRAFEGAAAGACVLNERGNPTLPHVFTPDVEYATYDDGDLEAVIARLLADGPARLAIARAGHARVRDHTYEAHWAAAVDALVSLAEDAPVPAVGRRERARIMADGWRTGMQAQWLGVDALRAAGEPDEAAERHEELAHLGGLAGERVPTEQDVRVAIRMAERASGRGDGPTLAATALALAATGDEARAVATA